MLPEYLNAGVGDTNIPEPIITPMIILTAARRPIFRFNPTSDFSSLIAAADEKLHMRNSLIFANKKIHYYVEKWFLVRLMMRFSEIEEKY